jgi:FkbM family methyltransferase
MNYLSQAGQDKWVIDFFKGKRDGYFVDIGAYDGKEISNTYLLEKEFGWDGVCIEPSIKMFRKLRENRNCRLLNRAAYSRNTIMSFDDIGVSSLITPVGKHRIKASTMRTILDEVGAPNVIDYISLDTEGSEYEVLLGFPFDKYDVVLWTIEHNVYYNTDKQTILKENIMKILTENNYVRVREDVLCNGDPRYPFEDWYVNSRYL